MKSLAKSDLRDVLTKNQRKTLRGAWVRVRRKTLAVSEWERSKRRASKLYKHTNNTMMKMETDKIMDETNSNAQAVSFR